MPVLYDFWITVQGLEEEAAKNLWLTHKSGTIHCTVFPDKAFIYGVAGEEKIQSIINDVLKLGKDYGLVRKEVI